MRIIKLIILPFIKLVFMIAKEPSNLKKVITSYPIAMANSQAGNLMADGKYQQALDKISWLDNKILSGRIGLLKARIYFHLKDHHAVLDIVNELTPYFEDSNYNENDKIYLILDIRITGFLCFLEEGMEHPEMNNEIAKLSSSLDLSKVDKSLMKSFPLRHLKGWYKHNPKDEYYIENIAKYGENN